ncbi:hypothetical protein SCOR_28540 [Sulfidibacter corallicola]|uniref:N-acetyltransferase domain-containing protein n=1 Tax=Sulfidibacter corallicola TaxID=2818388 RepID=A0A8A4TVE0_SULCO|nr:GNAT family N-acetyltransferase [Sulfidibacter corallicola]QTD50495.1 hypothetical protein J3U87_33340 [Sulfidibacter corallicola]
MRHIERVSLDRENEAWLRGAYPLYLHDLSEYGGDYRLDASGVWQPNYLDYWTNPAHPVLVDLIRVDGHFVGFSMVGHHHFPFKHEAIDYKICEFFVLRRARRTGIGCKAARAIWEDRPGSWELAVLRHNQPALAFWRAVLADLPRAEETPSEHDILFRFTV